MNLQKEDQQLKLVNYLGKMKILCKETPLISSSIAEVLWGICNIRDDSSHTQKLRDSAEKAYKKAIKRVPSEIKADVEKQLSVRPTVSLDEAVLELIRTEISVVRQLRQLIVALYVLLTGSSVCVKSHCFSCDNNEKPAVGYPAIMRLIHDLQSGKKEWDKDVEHLFNRIRNCKNRNSCAKCSSLYVMFLMWRDPSNTRILYTVCRSAHDKSEFAGQALVSFLRLPTVVGPESVLASVIESCPSGPMSVYIPSLIESLTALSAVETLEEKKTRLKYDEEMDARDFHFFIKHQIILYRFFMIHSGLLKEKGIEENVIKTVEECTDQRTSEARFSQLISLLRIYVGILKNPTVAKTDADGIAPWASTTVMKDISAEIQITFKKYLQHIPENIMVLLDISPDSPSSMQEQCVCSVCFDNIADSVLTCGHKLCGGCAGRILSSTCMCPTCRAPITKVVCKEKICLGGLCGHCDSSKQSPATHCHIGCGHRICCNDCAIQQGDTEKKCPSCMKSSRLIKIFDSD
jgi:hypothetical protein